MEKSTFSIFLVGLLLASAVPSEQKCPVDFVGQFMEAHNEIRHHHQARDLSYSKPLAYWAQDWASHLAAKGLVEHRPHNKYGENIYIQRSGTGLVKRVSRDGITPLDHWYEESDSYKWFGKEPPAAELEGYGNFTQLIWQSTTHVGVGCATSPKTGDWYVVAAYDPPGNFAGQFRRNVLSEGSNSGSSPNNYNDRPSSIFLSSPNFPTNNDFSRGSPNSLTPLSNFQRNPSPPSSIFLSNFPNNNRNIPRNSPSNIPTTSTNVPIGTSSVPKVSTAPRNTFIYFGSGRSSKPSTNNPFTTLQLQQFH